MDSTALLSVVGVTVLLSIIFLTSLCTFCWRHKQPTSIPQRSSGSSPAAFALRYPQSTYAPHPDPHRITSVPYQLPNSPSITVTKMPSCPPSETGSQASYVNQNDVPRTDDYITVIPDSPGTQPSSHSSEKTYINEDLSGLEEDSNSDCHDYENFQKSPDLQNHISCLSIENMSSDDERASSDYVNTEPNLL